MKNTYFIFVLLASVFISGCSKKQTNSFSASVNAMIGSAQFSSSKDKVSVVETAVTPGGTVGGTEQVTITAENDNSNGSYLVIAFGYAANDVKTYTISNQQAIGAYHVTGASTDDIAVSGTVTINSNDANEESQGKHLTGSFDFTTQNAVHITGTFSVQVNY